MLDQRDRPPVHHTSRLSVTKRIGSYLVDAGLLTLDQIKVALNDQQATGLRFGEILVARGWLKEQTIEWIVEKVIEPERATKQPEPASPQSSSQKKMGLQPSTANSVRTTVNPNDPELMQGLTRVKPMAQSTASIANTKQSQTLHNQHLFDRRPPITKPLPPVTSSDEDVSWVG